MCTITINPVFSTAPGAPGHTIVSLEGTYNCAGTIDVTIGCLGAASQATQALKINATMWIVNVDVPNCPCGSPITITATCNDTPPCTTTLNTLLLCSCCPTVNSTTVSQNVWNSSGQLLVTYVTNLTIPAGCSVTVQRFYGDGAVGAVHTFTSSPASYQETHAYNAQASYSSQLVVLSNQACSLPLIQITVPSAPPCSTIPFWATACRTLQVLFLLAAAAAGVLAIASTSPACVGANGALPATTGGLTITAMIFFFIVSAVCRGCICAFVWKLIGQMLFIMGMVALMFVLPANCTHLVPFATPNLALAAAMLLIAVGAGAVLYVIWYQNCKQTCPLTICDYWQTIKEALIIAVFVALAVYFILGTGMTPTHLGFDLLVIVLLVFFANQQIQACQNAGKC